MKLSNTTKTGFTLTEAVTSIVIVAIIWVIIADALVRAKVYLPYAKHETQSMYLAQRIFEEERRLNFNNITNQSAQPITIDTNGTTVTSDDFNGTYSITVYNVESSGPVYRKRVQLKINWIENSLVGSKNITEDYTTEIANDVALN